MAKFVKNGIDIEISELTQNEILNLTKINIQCKLIFFKDDIVLQTIDLVERTYRGNKNVIFIEYKGKSGIVNYDYLLDEISKNLSIGLLKVVVDYNEFKDKEALFLLLDKIKPEIIQTCVFIDYNSKKEFYSIVNQPIKNFSNKLYFYELNNSILLFNENGPKVIYNKFSGIEDILC